jgi:hypothetical protein
MKKKKNKNSWTGWSESAYQLRIEKLQRQLAVAQEKLSQADVQMLQKELNRLRSKIRHHEAASSIISGIVENIIDERGVVVTPFRPTAFPRPVASKKPKSVALVHLTDLHIGKVTTTYDVSIAKARLVELTRKVLKAILVHHRSQNVKELRIYLTGDMVEAENIFPHQAHQIDSSVFEQACYVAPTALAEMILTFLLRFEKVRVVAVKGNHGRVGRKTDGFAKDTNWDLIVYRIMDLLVGKAMAERPKEKWGKYELEVGRGFRVVDTLLGHHNLLFHGDNIRGYNGFPWYGVGKKISGWLASMKEDFEAAFFGHFHQYVSADWNGKRWYCSGSLESDNEFALEQMASMSLPQQRLQLWTADYEGPVVDMPILLKAGLNNTRKTFERRRPE